VGLEHPTGYLHDLIGTDRRKPTLNANGRLYGSTEDSTDIPGSRSRHAYGAQ
jgi:hypothetical protein